MSSSGPIWRVSLCVRQIAWFKKFGDPDFPLRNRRWQGLWLGALRHGGTPDVLPLDLRRVGKRSRAYSDAAGENEPRITNLENHALDVQCCDPGREALSGMRETKISCEAEESSASLGGALNQALRSAERALLVSRGTAAPSPGFGHALTLQGIHGVPPRW